ncbi:hypothetical protein [Enterococcus sp. AZ102]|uniref:hypothetical protein n=1 Tax=unclassified Enterococcus TaxID=2608891 RepID=UPI003F1EE180
MKRSRAEKQAFRSLLYQFESEGNFKGTKKLLKPSKKSWVQDFPVSQEDFHRYTMMYKQKTKQEIMRELDLNEIEYQMCFNRYSSKRVKFYYAKDIDMIISSPQYAEKLNVSSATAYARLIRCAIVVTEDFEHVDQVIEKYREKAKNEIKR